MVHTYLLTLLTYTVTGHVLTYSLYSPTHSLTHLHMPLRRAAATAPEDEEGGDRSDREVTLTVY